MSNDERTRREPEPERDEPTIQELPPKSIDEKTAEELKGGEISLNYTKVEYEYKK